VDHPAGFDWVCADLILLACSSAPSGWPEGPSQVLATLGEHAFEAEVLGFPDGTAKPTAYGCPNSPRGILQPASSARDVPGLAADVSTSVPDRSELWRGISGAAVLDEHDRLVGMVAFAPPGRQHRRLFVLPLDNGLVRLEEWEGPRMPSPARAPS
jgi:hypothetical protein